MNRLSDAEQEVMKEIWKAKKAVCRFDLEQNMLYKEWAATTLLTLLSRLEKKGYVSVEKRGKVKYYLPAVPEENYCNDVGRGILKRFFDNSITSFVASLAKEDSITKEELEELRKFLDEKSNKT